MVKYLYEVHPVRPVISPTDGRLTRRPFSAEFTTEQVKDMMPKARVFRRFPDHEGIIPVTGENRLSLHRPKYYGPKASDLVEPKKEGEPVAVVEDVVEVPAVEEQTEEVVETPEVFAETPVEEVQEETVEEAPVEEVTEAAVEETTEQVEEVTEEVATETAAIEDNVKIEEKVEESEVSEEVVENDEKETDSEEADVQDTEKKVPENNGGYFISNNNKNNKYHKSHKKH